MTMLIQFFMVPVMLSSLGKEGYGLWTLSFAVLGILTLVDMGFSMGAVRFTAEARGKQDLDERNRMLSTVLAVFLVLVVVIAAIVGVISIFYHDLFDLCETDVAHALPVLWILSLRMIIGLPLSIFRSILFGDRKITQVNIIQAAGALAYGVLGWIVLKAGYGIIGLAWVNAGTLLVEYAVYMIFAFATVEGLKLNPFHAKRKAFTTIMFISLAQFIVTLSGLVLLKMDPIIIKLFLPLTAVASYGVALKVAESVFLLLKQGVNVLGPRAAEFHGAGQMHLLLDFMISGMKFVTAPAAIIMFCVWMFGGHMLEFWIGHGFDDAVPALIILVTAICLSVPQLVASGIFTMTGHHKLTAIATAMGALINLVLSVILIQFMGITGVSIGTLCASLFIDLIVVLWLTGKYYGLTYGVFVTQVVLPQVIPSIVCLGILAAFRLWLPPWNIVSLLAVCAVAAAGYLFVFMKLSLIPSEQNFFRKALGRKVVPTLKPVIDQWPLTDEFVADYQELRRVGAGSSVFNDVDWLRAGIEFGARKNSKVVSVRFLDNHGLTAAMGIFAGTEYQEGRLNFKVLRTIDTNTQRFIPIVGRDRESISKAMHSLIGSFNSSYDVIDFFKLDGQFLESVRGCRRVSTELHDRQPRIIIDGSFEDYLAMRGRAHRKKIKRRRQYVEDAFGELTFVRLRSPEDYAGIDLQTLLDELFAIYERKWADDSDANPGVINSMKPFVCRIAPKFMQEGNLDICMLKAGPRILAFDINLVNDGVINMICGAYEPDTAHTGPGSALLIEEIRNSCERGDQVIEFGGGYLDYKMLWTKDVENSWHMRFFSTTAIGRIKHVAWRLSPRRIKTRLASIFYRIARSKLNGKLFEFGSFNVYSFEAMRALPVESLGLEARPVTPADLPALCRCRAMADIEKGSQEMAVRMSRGAGGLALWDKDRVVAYGWLNRGTNLQEDSDRYRMNMGQAGAYVFDTFIHPDFRGRSLYPVLVKSMMKHAESQGISQFYVTVDTTNERSIRAHQKAGVELIETVQFLDLGFVTMHDAVFEGKHRRQWDFKWKRRDFVSTRVKDGGLNVQENG